MPMYGTDYIFSKPFFRFWVALTFLWAFGATLTITLMPLIEGRKTIMMFFRFITGKRDTALLQTDGIVVFSSGEAVGDHELTGTEKEEQHVQADEKQL
jgi:hypothetical protein